MAAVPDTDTFTLQDVVDSIGGGLTSLTAAFAAANSAYFDPAYSGSKDNLLNFRNYGYKTTKTFSVADGGYIWNSDATWSTCRTASSGTLVSGADYWVGCDITGGLYYVWRTFIRFDISSITSGKTCLEAKLYFGVRTDGGITSHIVKGTQSTTLVGGDYDLFDSATPYFSSSQSRTDQSSCASPYYFTCTANSTERSNIASSFGSSLKIAMLEDHDKTGGTPISLYKDVYYRSGECVTPACTYCAPVLSITHTI